MIDYAKFGLVPIKYIKVDDDVKIPTYQHEGDSGCDICANTTIIIHPQETVLVPTGLKIQIPFGYELQIRPRSGLSLNTRLRIANTVGTIDSNFRDEVKVILTNTSIENKEQIIRLDKKGNLQGSYIINKYDRIAQFVLAKVEIMAFTQNDELSETSRNTGGFGSTGV